MKQSLAFTYHYMMFIGMTILLTPVKNINYKEEMNEAGIEKNRNIYAAAENTPELLQGDIFFKY